MLEFHPYADLFPLIEGEAFEELVADIRDNGIREPIVLFEGKILDGRNRYRAGVAAGVIDERGRLLLYRSDRVEPVALYNPLWGEPLAFVISANLRRRHLNETQRAMVAARIANIGHGGARGEQAANLPVAPVTQAQAAAALKVSERSVRDAKVIVDQGAPELVRQVEQGALAVSAGVSLAKLPKDEQTRIIRTADPAALYGVIKQQRDALTAQKKVRRAAREVALGARQRALPAKKYGVIYADPEWEHKPWSETGQNKAAANHYPVSSLDAIKTRPVGDIAARDCVLFMWTTAPHLADAFEVIRAWGFTYKSNFVWRKIYPGDQQGLGYWSRINHEHLLIATRGDVPAPAPGTQAGSVIEAPVGEHSEKPEAFAQLIEDYFPSLPKIELNARKARPGWDVWGNEAPEAEAEPPVAAAPKPAVIEARNTYLAGLGSPYSGGYREPAGAAIATLCPPGTIVRTNYGTGPYHVVELGGPYVYEPPEGGRFEHWSLCLTHVNSPKRKKAKLVADAWVNEVVAVDGRLLGLFENNSDEVFIVPPALVAPDAPHDFADAPAEGETLAIPAFLRRKPAEDVSALWARVYPDSVPVHVDERCPDTVDMLAGEG